MIAHFSLLLWSFLHFILLYGITIELLWKIFEVNCIISFSSQHVRHLLFHGACTFFIRKNLDVVDLWVAILQKSFISLEWEQKYLDDCLEYVEKMHLDSSVESRYVVGRFLTNTNIMLWYICDYTQGCLGSWLWNSCQPVTLWHTIAKAFP